MMTYYDLWSCNIGPYEYNLANNISVVDWTPVGYMQIAADLRLTVSL